MWIFCDKKVYKNLLTLVEFAAKKLISYKNLKANKCQKIGKQYKIKKKNAKLKK